MAWKPQLWLLTSQLSITRGQLGFVLYQVIQKTPASGPHRPPSRVVPPNQLQNPVSGKSLLIPSEVGTPPAGQLTAARFPKKLTTLNRSMCHYGSLYFFTPNLDGWKSFTLPRPVSSSVEWAQYPLLWVEVLTPSTSECYLLWT